MKHYYSFFFLLFVAANVFAQADESIKTFPCRTGYPTSVHSVALSSDAKYILSGSDNGILKLWDVISGYEIFSISGHNSAIFSVALSSDGKYMLTGSNDKEAKLWDVQTGRLIRSFGGHSKTIWSVAISSDSKYVLLGSEDKTITLWDIQSGAYLRILSEAEQTAVRSVAFSRDSKYVLSGDVGKTLSLWDVQGQKKIRTFVGHNGMVSSVTFSPNGHYALSGSTDKTAKLWDVQTGKEIRTFSCRGLVFSVAFSPDGNYILCGTSDGSIILWDSQTGEEIHSFSGHSWFVNSVVFSSDGKYAISGSEDKTIKMWDIAEYTYSVKREVENYVNQQQESWQKKEEFEKTSDYLIRVSEENRKKNIAKWQQEKIDELSKLEAQNYDIKYFTLKEYDADNETYLLSGTDRNYIIKVPLSAAPFFKQTFANGLISNQTFILTDAGFKLNGFSITCVPGTYSWNHTKDNPYQQTNINYNFEKAEINLPTTQENNKQNNIEVKQISVGKSDVDINIPSTSKRNLDTYVLVIGNEDYGSYQMGLEKEANVTFAANDAEVFAKYCEKTLGIPSANISLIKNATLGQMGQAISKLEKLAEIGKGNAELIFYYAGHGLPNEETKESYLIPVDVSGSNITSGIRSNDLYNRLGKFPTKKVTIFLDACFSGGSRDGQLIALRSVRIKPKEETIANNMVVFTSSSGTESSAAYKEKGHGMFTYYLLKKLMDSKGEATYKELGDYLQQQVLKQSVLINNKEQTPQVKTGSVDASVWGGWKF